MSEINYRTATGSRTPIQLRNVSPKLAPTIPVRTTMRADTDGSAPVSFAAANARGEVMQRVKGASDIYKETVFRAPNKHIINVRYLYVPPMS